MFFARSAGKRKSASSLVPTTRFVFGAPRGKAFQPICSSSSSSGGSCKKKSRAAPWAAPLRVSDFPTDGKISPFDVTGLDIDGVWQTHLAPFLNIRETEALSRVSRQAAYALTKCDKLARAERPPQGTRVKMCPCPAQGLAWKRDHAPFPRCECCCDDYMVSGDLVDIIIPFFLRGSYSVGMVLEGLSVLKIDNEDAHFFDSRRIDVEPVVEFMLGRTSSVRFQRSSPEKHFYVYSVDGDTFIGSYDPGEMNLSNRLIWAIRTVQTGICHSIKPDQQKLDDVANSIYTSAWVLVEAWMNYFVCPITDAFRSDPSPGHVPFLCAEQTAVLQTAIRLHNLRELVERPAPADKFMTPEELVTEALVVLFTQTPIEIERSGFNPFELFMTFFPGEMIRTNDCKYSYAEIVLWARMEGAMEYLELARDNGWLDLSSYLKVMGHMEPADKRANEVFENTASIITVCLAMHMQRVIEMVTAAYPGIFLTPECVAEIAILSSISHLITNSTSVNNTHVPAWFASAVNPKRERKALPSFKKTEK